MVLDPKREEEAKAIFRKWGLDFAIVGHTTDDLRFVVKHGGETKADLPIKDLGDEAPIYERPWVETPKQPVIAPGSVTPPIGNADALVKLVGGHELSSRRWVYEQYDTLIQGNSVMTPGGDAGIVRVLDGPKGLAMTTDVTPRYCEADPFEGGKQAVAEAWRNITAVGGLPMAVTDNLNFGNPERPEIMGQFVGCLKGIGEACRALDFPIVSGNVSLYNETNGRAILPTPAIGGVGLLDDVSVHATIRFRKEGEAVVLIGETAGWIGQSVWLRDICGREEGAPPPVDLVAERRNGDFVRGLIRAGKVRNVHDCSDGGLAVALAEMVMAGGVGADIDTLPSGVPAHAALFGEDQARYVIALSDVEADAVLEAAAAAGVPALRIGRTGGSTLTLPGERAISLTELTTAHERWFPAFMAGEAN